MKTKIALLAVVSLALCCYACDNTGSGSSSGTVTPANVSGGTKAPAAKGQDAPQTTRQFPDISIPSVYGANTPEAREYVLQHYWDAFFKGDWNTTHDMVLGVTDAAFEQALANYIQILQAMKLQATPDDMEPFRQARNSVKRLFTQLETHQLADTSAKTYLRVTETVSKYLYDPNSPLRDEDLYLPFVEGMVASACTRENMRNAYRFEASQCRTNGFGQTVPDFSYKDARGNKSSLNAVRAEYTLLFFSNPGCTSCKEIINDIGACGCIHPMIAAGRLAIVNIYIDEEVQKWREYLHNYPKDWINGYDYTFSLRDSGKFDIRAIPSLYLLDSRKRVIMKDAPTANVLSYLENIYNQ